MSESMTEILARLESKMQCQCDLDRWEPEKDTGHSWACPIHKEAKRLKLLKDENEPRKSLLGY